MEKPFTNTGVTNACVAFSACHRCRKKIEIGFSLIISIYKVVYITVTNLHAGYAAKHVGETCCQSCKNVRFWIGGNHSRDDVQLSIILKVSNGGEVFHFIL